MYLIKMKVLQLMSYHIKHNSIRAESKIAAVMPSESVMQKELKDGMIRTRTQIRER